MGVPSGLHAIAQKGTLLAAFHGQLYPAANK